jgi:membrane associated rhomboid family serine protease
MNPTPVGMRCPDCASEKTKVINARAEPRLQDVAPLTFALIVVNVIAFLSELATGASLGGFTSQLSGDALLHGSFFGPAIADYEWWRVVTSGFLHLGLLHIGMNMVLLYYLGTMLEPAIGRLRFGLIYLASLIGGGLGSILLEPSVHAVGASGAVFGLMGAAVVAMKSRGINPFEGGIGGLIIFNLVITFLVPGISKGGHLGGLVAGLVVGYVLIELDERRRLFGRNPIPAAGIALVLAAATFAATVYLANDKFPRGCPPEIVARSAELNFEQPRCRWFGDKFRVEAVRQ